MKFSSVIMMAFGMMLMWASGTTAHEHQDQAAPACATEARAQANGYWLDADLARIDGAWKLTPLTNIRFAPQKYGGAPAPGEGHVHLYLNGQLIGPITHEGPVLLPLLDQETYVVKLALAASNHSEAAYGVCREIRVGPASDAGH